MSVGETPQITSSVYGQASTGLVWEPVETENALQRVFAASLVQPAVYTPPSEPMANSSTRRIVQIFIADADPNVPLEQALLHKSEPSFTDATDQELYFGIPVAELLKSHNEKRKTWLDKEATRKAGKDIFLEPAKIRDLKMVVVTVAQF